MSKCLPERSNFRVQIQISVLWGWTVPWEFLLDDICIVENTIKHQVAVIWHPDCCVAAQNFLWNSTKSLIRKSRFLMIANDMKIAILSQSTHWKIRQPAQKSKSGKRSLIIHIFIHQRPHQLSYHDSKLFHANSPFILSAYRKYGKIGWAALSCDFCGKFGWFRGRATWKIQMRHDSRLGCSTNLHKANRAHRCRWSRELRSLLF